VLSIQVHCTLHTAVTVTLCLQWILYNEDKHYPVVCDGDKYRAMIQREGGQVALEQWLSLEAAMKPLQTGASSFPAAAIRSDPGRHPKP